MALRPAVVPGQVLVLRACRGGRLRAVHADGERVVLVGREAVAVVVLHAVHPDLQARGVGPEGDLEHADEVRRVGLRRVHGDLLVGGRIVRVVVPVAELPVGLVGIGCQGDRRAFLVPGVALAGIAEKHVAALVGVLHDGELMPGVERRGDRLGRIGGDLVALRVAVAPGRVHVLGAGDAGGLRAVHGDRVGRVPVGDEGVAARPAIVLHPIDPDHQAGRVGGDGDRDLLDEVSLDGLRPVHGQRLGVDRAREVHSPVVEAPADLGHGVERHRAIGGVEATGEIGVAGDLATARDHNGGQLVPGGVVGRVGHRPVHLDGPQR